MSHQSWKKDCTGCPTIVGTRQEKGKAIGICMEGGFLEGNFWISSHRCRRGIGNFYHLPDLDRWIHLMRRNLKRLRNQHCTTNHKWNTVGWKLFHWDIRMNRSCRLAGTCKKPEKSNNFGTSSIRTYWIKNLEYRIFVLIFSSAPAWRKQQWIFEIRKVQIDELPRSY